MRRGCWGCGCAKRRSRPRRGTHRRRGERSGRERGGTQQFPRLPVPTRRPVGWSCRWTKFGQFLVRRINAVMSWFRRGRQGGPRSRSFLARRAVFCRFDDPGIARDRGRGDAGQGCLQGDGRTSCHVLTTKRARCLCRTWVDWRLPLQHEMRTIHYFSNASVLAAISGSRSISDRRTTAALSGARRSCSQSRRVPRDKPYCFANVAWDNLCYLRMAATFRSPERMRPPVPRCPGQWREPRSHSGSVPSRDSCPFPSLALPEFPRQFPCV